MADSGCLRAGNQLRLGGCGAESIGPTVTRGILQASGELISVEFGVESEASIPPTSSGAQAAFFKKVGGSIQTPSRSPADQALVPDSRISRWLPNHPFGAALQVLEPQAMGNFRPPRHELQCEPAGVPCGRYPSPVGAQP